MRQTHWPQFTREVIGKVKQNQPRLIILGAGKPFSGEEHSVLRGTTGRRRVLDWLLHAMRFVGPTVHFVGGYQLDEIAERYPELHYSVNPHWQTTGAAASLLEAPLSNQAVHFVSYSDVLFRDSAVQSLASSEADIAVLVDTRWRHRFDGRSAADLARCEKVNVHDGMITRLGRDIMPELADAEFVGLVRLQPRVAGYLAELGDVPEWIRTGSLTQLLEFLRVRGFSVAAVDVAGGWAELNEPSDLSRFILGTKAQTLHRLQGVVSRSRIEDQVSFTVAEWLDNDGQVLDLIAERLAGAQALVVRSSALSEDGFGVSNAGAYTSVLNVNGQVEGDVRAAIEKVIASYPDGHPDNQVLVQPMLEQVIASGVAFTRTLSSGAPYYVVNYDDTTSSTESITSGASRDHKTLFVRRRAPAELIRVPGNLTGLMPALREIEDLLDFDSLDIEFAITQGGLIHILQVRPIAVQHELTSSDAAEGLLENAVIRFRQLQAGSPFVVGQHGYFGVMPDWNPAEIIGTRPGRMAASLYRYLIMDNIWAAQRAEYGYRDVRPQPLLTMFAGHPYVDIRASFNSFIPQSIEDGLAGRLVDFYMEWLRRHPHLHDKVEFDVVPTCYALDFERWRVRLLSEGGFSAAEVDQLGEGLKAITACAMARTGEDLEAVHRFKERLCRFDQSRVTPLDHALTLLEECQRYGTLAFAHLARSAFVAITLLRSAVETGALSQAAMDAFLNSIRTVSHRFTDDAAKVACDELSMDEFTRQYGHLRPGTYDITSPCYGDNPEHFLVPVVERAARDKHSATDQSTAMGPWESEKHVFARAMSDAGLPTDIEQLEQFMRNAIEGREYAKFVFTQHLSLALDALAQYGAQHGITRQQLADIPIEALSALRAGTVAVADEIGWLAAQATQGRETNCAAALVELPPLLLTESDFHAFLYTDSHANFVGAGKVSAECVDLQKQTATDYGSLAGKIAMIPQADPGYDWLFGHGIAGLITTYGGANSHMAIRAAEFGLPAAIGVGEGKYETLARASVLSLDPVNKRIEVVR